jgi:hypothetical protein
MKLISLLLDKLLNLLIVVGVIGLIMGIINTFKGRPQQAKYGFLLFGVLVLAIVLSHVLSWIISKIQQKKDAMKPATGTAAAASSVILPIQEQPLTVLGMVVIMENPLRFPKDEERLISEILAQQTGDFKRVIAPSAQVKIVVAGASLDDDAYIYGVCRSNFDGLDAYSDHDEFLQRVATGFFVASDGNRGKHFAFLNRKM